ncbi:hypothetical protein D3C84_194840 [compost metagenome]
MAGEKTIATLVGKLRFEADNRPLLTFEKRLDAVAAKMQSLSTLASKKINLKIGTTSSAKEGVSDLSNIQQKITDLGNMKIKLGNLSVGQEALSAAKKRIQDKLDVTKISLKNVGADLINVKQKLADIGKLRVKLSNISAGQDALSAAQKQIQDRLSIAKVSIKNVGVNIAALRAQKTLMRDLLESTTIDLPIELRLRAAEKSLRAWKKRTEEKFKLHIHADISRHKFLQNVKKSLEFVSGKIGTIKLGEPKIKLVVDRVALKAEIASVLQEIERSAKIKIKLTSEAPRGDRTAPRERTAPGAARHAALTGGVAGATMGMGRGFIPGLGGAFALAQANSINQELQAQQLALTAVTGNEEAGAEQSKWVRDLSDKIGMDFRAVTPSFTKMLASGKTSGMSTESVQDIFQGVSEYGRVMGLDSESMKGSMRAIEQMMNKGQIMSEELKGQLAERMPGVMSAMAESAGFGTDDDSVAKLFKAMENGQVKSKAVLEKFAAILAERARAGGALEKAMKSTAAEQARFNNAFSRSIEVFAEGGFDRATAQFFREMAKGMEEALPLTKALGGAFEILMKPVNATIILIGKFGEALPKMADNLGLTEDGLVALGIAAVANLTPLGRIVTAISAIVLAVEDFMVFLEGGESVFGNWFEGLTPENQQALTEFGTAIEGLTGSLATLMGMVWEGWSGIFGYFEDGGAGIAVLSVITSFAEAINSLVDALERMRNGDFSDVMPDENTLPKIGRSFNNLVDAVLPGTPLTTMTNMLNSQTPEGQQAKLAAERDARIRQNQAARGSGADVPTISQKIENVEINITTDNPDVMRAHVQNHMSQMFNTTKQNLVEVRK